MVDAFLLFTKGFMPEAGALETPVVETAQPIVESAAPESQQQAEPVSHASRVDAILRQGGEAARKYRLTGELPAEAQTSTEETPQEQAGVEESAQTEAASAPAVTEQQPKKSRDRDWNAVKTKLSETERENIALKAQLDLLKSQSAGSRPSAPAANEKPVQVEATDDARPDIPDIAEFTDEKAYQKAMKDWHKADTDWVKRQMDSRFTSEKKTAETQQAAQGWAQRLDVAKKEFADFEAVAFSDKTPASAAMVRVIQSHQNGAKLAYWLGKNPAEAQRIFALTDTPDGASVAEIAEAVGMVKAEFSRIDLAKLSKSIKAAPAPKPLKEVIASAHRPSAEVEVEGNASPVADPVADALKASKDSPAAFARWKKLQNERDLAERKGARR